MRNDQCLNFLEFSQKQKYFSLFSKLQKRPNTQMNLVYTIQDTAIKEQATGAR